jgi:hypothetical protein
VTVILLRPALLATSVAVLASPAAVCTWCSMPGVRNLLRIFAALTDQPVASLAAAYGGAGYGRFEKDLAEVVAGTLARSASAP